MSLPPVMKQYVQSVVDSRWEQWRSEGWVGQQCIVDGIGSEVLYLCVYVHVCVHACALCVKVCLCFNAMRMHDSVWCGEEVYLFVCRI